MTDARAARASDIPRAVPVPRRCTGLRARIGAVAVAVAALAAVATPACAGDAAAGKLKAASCATCHGAAGLSTLPNAPNLAGQPEVYVVEQLRAYRSGKRANEMMSVVARALSDRDIEDLAAWYGAIKVEAKPPD